MAENPTEEFSDAQRQAWVRLVSALRRVIEYSVALDASEQELERRTDQVEELGDALEPISGSKPVPRFAGYGPLKDGRPNDFLPYSPIIGRLNPIAPPVELTIVNERIIARVNFGAAYEGGLGFVHGGVVAMVWDQVLAMASVVAGFPGPTGELKVRYNKPTPLDRELRFEAWLDEKHERKTIARGRCFDSELCVSEAEGTFVRLDFRSHASGWGKQTAGALPERRKGD